MDARHAARSSLTIGAAFLLLVSGPRGCASVRTAPRCSLQPPAEARLERSNPADGGREASAVYLVLKLGERRLYVMPGDAPDGAAGYLESFPVAVGRREWGTPIGRFRVLDMTMNPDFLKFDWENPSNEAGTIPPGPDNPLGLRWIGFTSAYGWEIGFHGTPHPELLGQAVSHGCVRLHNRDVVALYERVRVGTTVIVQP